MALPADAPSPLIQLRPRGEHWVKVIDQTRCIGCHACTTACRSENEVPLGVTRTYVKAVDVGTFPQARRAFQVTRCNQCSDAPCVAACPTAAMFQRPDGIVDFDKSACIGCKACIAACPYDAIFINPEDHTAEKCNFCAHRLDVGLEPACVVVCPTQAILVGDLNDPASQVAAIIGREPVAVRRPEKETRPNLFYKGATQATLDPLAARRPAGGTFMWSELIEGPQVVNSGAPSGGWNSGATAGTGPRSGGWNSSAAAVLAYDIPHHAPWDWRVSLYTWTKGIAAGAYLVPLLLLLVGATTADGMLWRWFAPMAGGAFLALTGLILILDLEHPERFVKLFTRPQLRSWLVRGAILISGYAAVLFLHFLASLAAAFGIGPSGSLMRIPELLAVAGVPLAIGTAAYTAYLFAQAKARDLWQNPLLPAQFVVDAVLAGAAAALLVAPVLEPAATTALTAVLAVAAVVHLALVASEATLAHPTAHARLAAHELTSGRFAAYFRGGLVLVGIGLVAAGLVALGVVGAGSSGPTGASAPASTLAAALGWLAAVAALLGLLAHEHAYVQAGQAVPLA